MAATVPHLDVPAPAGGAGNALLWSGRLLVVASWISAAIFGTYIISFFGGVALNGASQRWNESLAGLYDARNPLATIAIGAHFITGGVLLLLGPIQLIGGVRRSVPRLHRWLGRIYVFSAALAGLGGVGFILSEGTIGGPTMNAGFGIYGTLIVICAAMAFVHARAGRYEQHRAWAIRLFALTVGSWLYRMEYGFWFLVVGRVGHTHEFTGWFDAIMAFFFYMPNLLIAELFIRARREASGKLANMSTATLLFAASAFVVVATWKFTADHWGPGIVSGLTGTHP